MARNRRDAGRNGWRGTTAGYSISFVAARETRVGTRGRWASARVDFRSMEQLTVETQGSSGSETSGYFSVYVPYTREMYALRKLPAPTLQIDDVWNNFLLFQVSFFLFALFTHYISYHIYIHVSLHIISWSKQAIESNNYIIRLRKALRTRFIKDKGSDPFVCMYACLKNERRSEYPADQRGMAIYRPIPRDVRWYSRC